MENLLDNFFENLEFCLQRKFPHYIVKDSQVKGSFYVLVREPREKILNNDLKILLKHVKSISNKMYDKFSENLSMFRHNFFPYFKLVRCYGNYHYHSLVIRKDYKR